MKSQIKREIIIKKTASEIYQIISNLGSWNTWSPWMHCEPTTKTELSGNANQIGQAQTWQGEVIGSGRMTIEDLKTNTLVRMKIEFFSPWKSVASSIFEIVELSPQESKVTWTMNSEMPLFMVFFKKMVEAFMGNDFERGLNMLKELAETGSVASKSIYQGQKQFQEFQVVGRKITCKISELSKNIPPEFEKLNKLFEQGKLEKPMSVLALTHKFDIVNGLCEITVGFAYSADKKIEIPNGYDSHHFPEHSALVVDHYGAYRNLRNPWAMAMTYQRMKKMKVSKKIPVYELYLSSPHGQSEMEVLTQIVVPLA